MVTPSTQIPLHPCSDRAKLFGNAGEHGLCAANRRFSIHRPCVPHCLISRLPIGCRCAALKHQPESWVSVCGSANQITTAFKANASPGTDSEIEEVTRCRGSLRTPRRGPAIACTFRSHATQEVLLSTGRCFQSRRIAREPGSSWFCRSRRAHGPLFQEVLMPFGTKIGP